jgi:hypothetical protein
MRELFWILARCALKTRRQDHIFFFDELGGAPIDRQERDHFHQLGGAAQAKRMQLLDHLDGLVARCGDVLAGMDRRAA